LNKRRLRLLFVDYAEIKRLILEYSYRKIKRGL